MHRLCFHPHPLNIVLHQLLQDFSILEELLTVFIVFIVAAAFIHLFLFFVHHSFHLFIVIRVLDIFFDYDLVFVNYDLVVVDVDDVR